MEIQILDSPLEWPELDALPMHELCHDWHGQSMAPPARFALVEDPGHLWLIAGRQQPANPHPMGDCGDFQAELWKHDVAEMFITDANFKNYLEFNLSPTGAWWAESFSGPREIRGLGQPPEVRTHAEHGEESWRACLGIPLEWLRLSIDWSVDSPLNVTFILDSPQQRFLSACDLGAGEPDFHRPQGFKAAGLRNG